MEEREREREREREDSLITNKKALNKIKHNGKLTSLNHMICKHICIYRYIFLLTIF